MNFYIAFIVKSVVLAICIVFTSATYSLERSANDYREMNEIALKSGADKGSSYHNYTSVYSRYFSPLRNQPIKFLEIGIYQGASVKMWEEYFPNADLHFIDITLSNVAYFSQRSTYHLCNQEDQEALHHFAKKTGGNFDIILDDGGHTMTQQISSFIALFPYVKSGGMYIIEDLHTSYWPGHFGGGGLDSTVHFLKNLIDDVNRVGAITGRASHLEISAEVLKTLNTYQTEILSIHFYDSIAIIFKR